METSKQIRPADCQEPIEGTAQLKKTIRLLSKELTRSYRIIKKLNEERKKVASLN